MTRAMLEAADERTVRELLEDAYAFSSSFTLSGGYPHFELGPFAIDFEAVDQLFKKAGKCYADESQVRLAIGSLIDLF